MFGCIVVMLGHDQLVILLKAAYFPPSLCNTYLCGERFAVFDTFFVGINRPESRISSEPVANARGIHSKVHYLHINYCTIIKADI
jgi:hypothetical protein